MPGQGTPANVQPFSCTSPASSLQGTWLAKMVRHNNQIANEHFRKKWQDKVGRRGRRSRGRRRSMGGEPGWAAVRRLSEASSSAQ